MYGDFLAELESQVEDDAQTRLPSRVQSGKQLGNRIKQAELQCGSVTDTLDEWVDSEENYAVRDGCGKVEWQT